MKRILRKFRYGEKGFTLIELLVVIAILGVLAAVAVPNVGKFIGEGKNEAADTELHNIQTAVLAGMADASSANVTGGGSSANFGNTGEATSAPYTGTECYVGPSNTYPVSDYIINALTDIAGSYIITTDGEVSRAFYPGI